MINGGNVDVRRQEETQRPKKETDEEGKVTGKETKSRRRRERGRYSRATLFRNRQQCHRLPHSLSHYPDTFKDVITQILFFLVVISINY